MQANVLDPLWEKLGKLGSGNAVLLAIPGNHDLDRPDPKGDNAAADRLLEKDGFEQIKEKFWDPAIQSYRRVISDAFAAYSEWWKSAPHRVDNLHHGILPGDFSATIERGARRIGIVGLNTTFLQLACGDYKGRLVWDANQLHRVCHDNVDVWAKEHDVSLLLTHQGPDWLTPEARKHGESEIAPPGRFAVQLYGHQHELDIKYIRQGGNRQAVRFCQGCSVFGMDKFGDPPQTQRAHGYAAGRIDFDGNLSALRIWPRIATNKPGGWRFIPDHEHAVLEAHEGTAPEPLASRQQTVSVTPVKSNDVSPIPTLPTKGAMPVSMDAAEARGIYGRRSEIRELSELIEAAPLVAVFGLTGIGKSTLINEVRRTVPVASRRSVSFRASAQMSLTHLYQQIAVVVGDESEDPQLPESGEIGRGLFLSRARNARPAFIHVEQAQHLFDNRGFRDPAIGSFLKLLAEGVPQIRVVLECRENPPALMLSSKHAKVWELRGLGREAVERFFRRPFPERPDCGWELPQSEVELVQQRLSHDRGKRGQAHPLAMFLLATVAEGRQLTPVAVLQRHPDLLVSELEKKLFHDLYDSVLNADEQRVLRICALYRDQIPDGHADHINATVTTTDAFGHLVRRCLLMPDEQHEWYSLHALIAELTAARISPSDLDRFLTVVRRFLP